MILVRISIGDGITYAAVFSTLEKAQAGALAFLHDNPLMVGTPGSWDAAAELLHARGDTSYWFSNLAEVDDGAFVDIEGDG